LLALAELARQAPTTRVAWSVRSPVLTRVFGGGAADALPARGQLGAELQRLRDSGKLKFVSGLRITEIRRGAGKLVVLGQDAQRRPVRLDGIDEIVCATGQRPDLSLTSELRVRLDSWLESTEALGPLIDPNVHSCGTASCGARSCGTKRQTTAAVRRAEMALSRRVGTVAGLGSAQTLAWASSYYLPAMLAAPMARELGVSTPRELS